MFDLVADIESYAGFLPWCGGSEVLTRDDTGVVARVDIDFKGIRKSFVTKNTNTLGQSIHMQLREGPFSQLEGIWRFTGLGDSAKVSLDLEFEFAGGLVGRALGPVFNSIAGTMVDSFVKRAEQVYGKRTFNQG